MTRHALAVLVIVVGLALAGCGLGETVEDEAKRRLENPFKVQDGAEAQAEALLHRFSDHLDDGDYGAACEDMVPALQLRLAAQSGSCERAMRYVGQAGSLGHLEVENSHKTDHGLWVDAGQGKFLIRKNRIANIVPPGQ